MNLSIVDDLDGECDERHDESRAEDDERGETTVVDRVLNGVWGRARPRRQSGVDERLAVKTRVEIRERVHEIGHGEQGRVVVEER